jgi:HAMP domain-containing protein
MTTVVIVALALAVVALSLVLLRRRHRSRPLERLIEEMERVDLSTPGALPSSIDGVGETEEV